MPYWRLRFALLYSISYLLNMDVMDIWYMIWYTVHTEQLNTVNSTDLHWRRESNCWPESIQFNSIQFAFVHVWIYVWYASNHPYCNKTNSEYTSVYILPAQKWTWLYYVYTVSSNSLQKKIIKCHHLPSSFILFLPRCLMKSTCSKQQHCLSIHLPTSFRSEQAHRFFYNFF